MLSSLSALFLRTYSACFLNRPLIVTLLPSRVRL